MSSNGQPITVPREIVNDDTVIIAEWRAVDQSAVQKGEVIVLIETSKSVVEVESEADGYLQILHAEGEEVEVGAVIGRIQERRGEAATASPAADRKPAAHGVSVRFSQQAEELLERHGIDRGEFAGRGLVRRSDVEAWIATTTPPVSASDPAEASESLPTSPREPGTYSKGLWEDMRISSRERGRSVPATLLSYFWHNWLLGHMARWLPRLFAIPCHRLRGVRIGAGCFIDPTAVVETAYPENVTIGNDVRVTAHATIMTHIKPPHYLRESGLMPSSMNPVVLEDHCFIGVGAVIMPGVTVGRASVVASGAVVLADVPAFTMVGGNPAKVIRRFTPPETDHEHQ